MCPDRWIEDSLYGMGCLLMNSSRGYSWEDASAHCQQENSSLVELWFPEQSDFLLRMLTLLAGQEGRSHNWWVAGTDLGREGRWLWQGSLAPVPDFVWHYGYPRYDTSLNCLMLEDAWNYAGYDYNCTYKAMPICQRIPRRRTTKIKTTSKLKTTSETRTTQKMRTSPKLRRTLKNLKVRPSGPVIIHGSGGHILRVGGGIK